MPSAQYLGGVLSSTKLKVRGMKQPDARPPKNCIVSSMGKLVTKGVSNEITANEMEAPINTRLGPKAAPIQTAGIVMSIWAAVCAVVIHAPSSNPAPTAPRMSARPKFDNRPFRVDMNVPMRTATSPNHGMEVGGVANEGCERPDPESGAGVGAFISGARLWHRPSLPRTCRAPIDRRDRPHHR